MCLLQTPRHLLLNCRKGRLPFGSLQYLVICLVSFGLFGPALSTTNINIVKWRYFVFFSSVFFLFLELGIFLFKLGKKHTFWHWEHDRISVVKTGQKKPCCLDGWLRMGLLPPPPPPPREFCRHILSCRELKAESFKKCLHSVLRGVSL